MLTSRQQRQFEEDGLLLLPDLFTAGEVARLRAELPALFAQDHPGNIRERDSGEVRTAMGLHLRSESFGRLVRHPRLLEAAQQLRGDALYVQQVKVNVKAAFEGEQWQWHYDFATHHAEDGVPAPLALNLHVFLDDVTEFNGPLYFIPGSHKRTSPTATLDTETTSYPLWVVGRDSVKAMAAERGLVSATGRAGTALIFGDAMLHASPANISPWDRAIFSVILNPVSNALTRHTRPDYKHHRDLTPITALDDDCLLQVAGAA